MRRITILIAVVTVMGFGLAANAAVDLGDGACQETSTGEQGLWNGTTADDDGCVTQAEYTAMYATPETPEPLEQKVSVQPELEPEAPTVREFFEDVTIRLTAFGLVIE